MQRGVCSSVAGQGKAPRAGYLCGLTDFSPGPAGTEPVHPALYVVPAAIIYHTKKTRKMAMISLIAGGVILVIAGMLLNAWYLLPKYSELYGIPLDVLIAMGTKVNASITDVFSFVALAVAPFNIIKALIDGIVTVILYKYLSHQLKA